MEAIPDLVVQPVSGMVAHEILDGDGIDIDLDCRLSGILDRNSWND